MALKREVVFYLTTLLIIWCGVWGEKAQGIEYPWIDPANTQVLIIKDAKVDFALKVAAMDRATSSIDVLAYIQATDAEVGLPTIEAFLRAQQRGIKGRFLMDGVGRYMGGLSNSSARILSDPALPEHTETLILGALAKTKFGMRLTDMMHKKITIIDRGTPNELIWISGRNNSPHSGKDLDLGFILRPIDSSKPYIGDQIKADFEYVWETCNKMAPVHKGKGKGQLRRPITNAQIKFSKPEQQLEFARINDLLKLPVQPTRLEGIESRPKKMRVLTNDLFANLLTRIWSKGRTNRKSFYSEIDNALAESFKDADKIYASSMQVSLDKEIRNSIESTLDRGGQVSIYTNGEKAHLYQAHVDAGYQITLQDLGYLMKRGGAFSAYLMDADKLEAMKEEYGDTRYSHMKLAIVHKGNKKTSFIGSHNINEQSRYFADEIVIQSEDSDFADKLLNVIESDHKAYTLLDCETLLLDQKKNNIVKRAIGYISWPLY